MSRDTREGLYIGVRSSAVFLTCARASHGASLYSLPLSHPVAYILEKCSGACVGRGVAWGIDIVCRRARAVGVLETLNEAKPAHEIATTGKEGTTGHSKQHDRQQARDTSKQAKSRRGVVEAGGVREGPGALKYEVH